jgi:uncharacterized protein (DUF433 family)
MIDWSSCSAVERDPARVSGAWLFRGTRVPVAALFENLEDDASLHDFLEWFPGVTSEQARAVLDHVAKSAVEAAWLKVLFDQGTPAPLRRALTAHVVETAYERGWSELQNGALVSAAEEADFEVFVTTDKNLKYQQNLAERRLAIVVLLSTSWPRIQNVLPSVVAAVADASPGSYQEVSV